MKRVYRFYQTAKGIFGTKMVKNFFLSDVVVGVTKKNECQHLLSLLHPQIFTVLPKIHVRVVLEELGPKGRAWRGRN